MGSITKIFNIIFSVEELPSYQNNILEGHTFRHNVFWKVIYRSKNQYIKKLLFDWQKWIEISTLTRVDLWKRVILKSESPLVIKNDNHMCKDLNGTSLAMWMAQIRTCYTYKLHNEWVYMFWSIHYYLWNCWMVY
jgi:hypothetical protein